MKIEIFYTHYTKGVLQGFVGYHMIINARKLTIQQTTPPLFALSKHVRAHTKQFRETPVWFSAKVYPPSAAMIGILKPLRDQGLFTVATVDGATGWQSWYKYIDHLIVRLHSDVWVAFRCRELWYSPTAHIEPTFVADDGAPVLFLDLAEITAPVVDDFLKGSPQPWRILTEVAAKFCEEVK